MKVNTLTCAILALSLVAGPSAFAQGSGLELSRSNERQARDQGGRNDGPGRNERGPDRGRDQGRDKWRDQGRPNDYDRRGERGAGPDHSYYRGARMPTYYRSSQFVVDDWRGHHLRQPPRGYHWVQSGGDYILVAIATGIILEILLNN
jgi:Ni/Co efflux regulator RcnB